MSSPAKRQEVVENEKPSLEDELASAFDEMKDDRGEDVEEGTGDESEEPIVETNELIQEEKIDSALDQVDYNEAAPERWPEDIKAAYNSLPPSGKRAMLEGVFKPMQRQYGQVTTELSQMRKTVEPMLQNLQQYRADFERVGMDPISAINTQVAWAAHLSRVGPEQGLKDMAAAYGLNQQQQAQDQGYLTPAERQMQAQLQSLQQENHSRKQQEEQYRQQQAQEFSQRRFQEVQQGLNAFINEQIDGKPVHPHVEKLAPSIAGIIRGGLVNKFTEYGEPVPIRDQLQKAYNMACNLDPATRVAVSNQGQVKRAIAAQDVNVVTKAPHGKAMDDSIFNLGSAIEDAYSQLSKKRA